MRAPPLLPVHLVLALGVGCNADVATLGESTVTKIGPAGGRAVSPDRAQLALEFPAGALANAEDIRIEVDRSRPKAERLSPIYRLGPDGLTFAKPVAVTLSASPIAGRELVLAQVVGDQTIPLEGSAFDPRDGRVHGTLDHFSDYTLTSRAGSGADGGVGGDARPSLCTRTFAQNARPIVDLLVIIDNSGSMAEEQLQLARQFDLLLGSLNALGADFHLGVTTTDVALGAARGILIGTPSILTSSTPNLAQVFAGNVSAGIDGSTSEQGLEAARLALAPATNPGFLRPQSSVFVLYVSDEEDQSFEPAASYAAYLAEVRDSRRLRANAIAGDSPMGCATADPGARYAEVVRLTGGVFESICQAPWGRSLTELGGPGFGYLHAFSLGGDAGPIVSVRVGGQLIQAVGEAGVNWTYDPLTGTLDFSQAALPPPGAEIEVETGC